MGFNSHVLELNGAAQTAHNETDIVRACDTECPSFISLQGFPSTSGV